jgi:hypothetical protein
MILLVLTWGVAPLLGGLFLTFTGGYTFTSGAIHLNHYYLLFVISAFLFLIPFSLRHRVKVGDETPTSQVLAYMSRPIANVFGPFIRVARKSSDQRDDS